MPSVADFSLPTAILSLKAILRLNVAEPAETCTAVIKTLGPGLPQ